MVWMLILLVMEKLAVNLTDDTDVDGMVKLLIKIINNFGAVGEKFKVLDDVDYLSC